MGYFSKLQVIRRGGHNRQYYLICPAPLAAALELSRKLQFDAQFEKLAAKELKMRVRDLRRIKEQAAEMLAKAEVNGE